MESFCNPPRHSLLHTDAIVDAVVNSVVDSQDGERCPTFYDDQSYCMRLQRPVCNRLLDASGVLQAGAHVPRSLRGATGAGGVGQGAELGHSPALQHETGGLSSLRPAHGDLKGSQISTVPLYSADA